MSLLNEILQEMETSQLCNDKADCSCAQCQAKKNQRHGELYHFTLELPAEVMEFESKPLSLRQRIQNRLRFCLRKLQGVSVASSAKAGEIILELQYDVQSNLRSGDHFKFRIYNQIKECMKRFKSVKVDVETKNKKIIEKLSPTDISNLRKRKLLRSRNINPFRFIDIRVMNGNKVLANIETKKGYSPYYRWQRAKDEKLKQSGRGPTWVIRKCPPGSTHPDCLDYKNKPSRKSKEISLLQEIFQESEI